MLHHVDYGTDQSQGLLDFLVALGFGGSPWILLRILAVSWNYPWPCALLKFPKPPELLKTIERLPLEPIGVSWASLVRLRNWPLMPKKVKTDNSNSKILQIQQNTRA